MTGIDVFRQAFPSRREKPIPHGRAPVDLDFRECSELSGVVADHRAGADIPAFLAVGISVGSTTAPSIRTSSLRALSISDFESRDRNRNAWALWQRVAFRFFAVYFVLQIAPWNWFRAIPGMSFFLRYLFIATDWLVRAVNGRFFHVRDRLVPVNGSGDTSWAWAQLCLYVSLAAIACIVWSVVDRKRSSYPRGLYWLRLIVRYYVASAALSYGIIKLFLLQMPFPALSQLATPLGDLLPMRFSWLFIGYSVPYQFFSGAMETAAGLLLLYRRTVTAGLFAATGAFMNVVMINIAYDVPVKLYSSHLLFSCLFLLALDAPRLVRFLVLNQPTPPTNAYDTIFEEPWMWWTSVAVKVFIVFQILIFPLRSGFDRYRAAHAPLASGPFKVGMYEVRDFAVNRQSIPLTAGDSLRWRDVIFDSNSGGSINTTDSLFWQRYRRGYFRYKANPADQTLSVWKNSFVPRDSTFLFAGRYATPDSNTIVLDAQIRGDSVHVEMVRLPRHFQLTERQFHWLSEYNR